MKATGQLKFTRHTDETITHEWTGGRRISITGELIAVLLGSRQKRGSVVEIGGIELRLIMHDVAYGAGSYRDAYIAMREGRLARFVSWYVDFALRWADPLFAWEWRWLRGKGKPYPVAVDYPSRSLVGLLLRPLT